jgi:hypothetical protein
VREGVREGKREGGEKVSREREKIIRVILKSI